MKILQLDYDYFYYPEGISDIDEFVIYANKNYNSFISLTRLNTENSVPPYFVKEDTELVYINIANIQCIRAGEATILCREEYDERLNEIVNKKCIDCEYYEENSEGDNLKGHRNTLSLDGECWRYSKKTE